MSESRPNRATMPIDSGDDPRPPGPTAARGSSELRERGRRAARRLASISAARSILRHASLAGLVPAAVWRRLPVETTFVVNLPKGESFRYSSIPQDGIGRKLFWRGLKAWEAETIPTFLKLAARSRWFIDVGANTGAYSLLACAANAKARVLAFEPVPYIFGRLREQIAINGFSERCETLNKAVADHAGTARLHVPAELLPTSARLSDSGFRDVPGSVIEVEVTTLDEACPDALDVDLIKIDVEGHEESVLAGMTRILTEGRPAIIVECNPDGPGEQIASRLAPLDYRFFHIQAGGPREMPTIVPDQAEKWRNYLCLPESKRSWLTPEDDAR